MTPPLPVSALSTILGLNPWGSAVKVWAETLGLVERVSTDTPATRRGRGLEWAVACWWAMERGVLVIPGDPIERPGRVNPELPWLSAHVDAFSVLPTPATGGELEGVVEVKTARWLDESEWGPSGEGPVPRRHAIQARGYLAVTGSPCAWLVALGTVDDDLRSYRIDRDLGVERRLLAAARRWYDAHIVGGEPPAPDGLDATRQTLARLPAEEGKEAVLLAADVPLVEKARGLRRTVKDSTQAVERLRQELMLRMGDAEVLVDERGRVVATFKGSPVRRWRWANHDEEDE